MIYRLAHFISFITNPLLLLIPVPFLLVYRVTFNIVYAVQWTLISLVFLLFIGLFVVLGVRRGYFSNFDVSIRRERPLLFIMTGIVALFFFLAVFLFGGPKVLYAASFGLMFGVFVLSVVNTRVKASIHVATATVVLLTIGILYNLPLAFYLLIPLVAWSRVTLKRHSVLETIVGCILGMSLILFLYSVLKFGYNVSI